MKIVIAGGGKIGEVLCRELSIENNDIVLIEKNPERLERIINKNDITGLVGNGADYNSLVESGVKNCDIFISVTPKDEINIIGAIIAKRMGATHTIARVRNPEYAGHMGFVRESLGISMMINPEFEAAKDISRVIRFPEALTVEQFANGRVNIVEVAIKSNEGLDGISLVDFRKSYKNLLICAVKRNNETFIPSGETVLKPSDHIFVTGGRKDLTEFYHKLGYEDTKVSSALIVGGSKIAYYLMKMLSKSRMEIKLIEKNKEKARELSEEFPKVVVIKGDGSNQEFLKEERIQQYDSVITLTGFDEENILISLFASTLNTKKIITKVNRTDLLKILDNVDLQTIITPQRIIASKILRFVRSLGDTQVSNVEALYRIADNKVEALQFKIKESSRVINIPLKDLETKTDLLIAYIVRDKQLIFPSGEDEIKTGDRVIVVTTTKKFDDIDDILAKNSSR